MKPLDFQDLVIKRLNKLEAALLAVLELQSLEGEVVNKQINSLLELVSLGLDPNKTSTFETFNLSRKYGQHYQAHLRAVTAASDFEVAHLRAQPFPGDDAGTEDPDDVVQ